MDGPHSLTDWDRQKWTVTIGKTDSVSWNWTSGDAILELFRTTLESALSYYHEERESIVTDSIQELIQQPEWLCLSILENIRFSVSNAYWLLPVGEYIDRIYKMYQFVEN